MLAPTTPTTDAGALAEHVRKLKSQQDAERRARAQREQDDRRRRGPERGGGRASSARPRHGLVASRGRLSRRSHRRDQVVGLGSLRPQR